MDFSLNNFPDGINVMTNYLDSLDWYNNSQPKGVMIIPFIANKERCFDWWNLDTSQLSSFDCNENNSSFVWKKGETELIFDCTNMKTVNPGLEFNRIPEGCTIRFIGLDNITSFGKYAGGEDTTLDKLYLEGASTSVTGGAYITASSKVKEVHLHVDCSKLNSNTSLFSSTNNVVKYFNGCPNLKSSQTGNYFLKTCGSLTYQSCVDILNNLYDFTGNGETPSSSQGKLKVHANFLTTVGDDISIGTNKGWTITT